MQLLHLESSNKTKPKTFADCCEAGRVDCGCWSRPSGGTNTHIRFFCVDLSSLLLISSDPELTSTVGWFCSVMLTADWNWRGNGLYFMNVTLQRGDREPEPESLLSADFTQSFTWIQTNTPLRRGVFKFHHVTFRLVLLLPSSLTGDQMKLTFTSRSLMNVSGLNIVGNISDNVTTKPNM